MKRVSQENLFNFKYEYLSHFEILEPEMLQTQAEYEKVVKGARLTDPVEEPISRTCTSFITCLCPNTPPSDGFLYGCFSYHTHKTDCDFSDHILHSLTGT